MNGDNHKKHVRTIVTVEEIFFFCIKNWAVMHFSNIAGHDFYLFIVPSIFLIIFSEAKSNEQPNILEKNGILCWSERWNRRILVLLRCIGYRKFGTEQLFELWFRFRVVIGINTASVFPHHSCCSQKLDSVNNRELLLWCSLPSTWRQLIYMMARKCTLNELAMLWKNSDAFIGCKGSKITSLHHPSEIFDLKNNLARRNKHLWMGDINK